MVGLYWSGEEKHNFYFQAEIQQTPHCSQKQYIAGKVSFQFYFGVLFNDMDTHFRQWNYLVWLQCLMAFVIHLCSNYQTAVEQVRGCQLSLALTAVSYWKHKFPCCIMLNQGLCGKQRSIRTDTPLWLPWVISVFVLCYNKRWSMNKVVENKLGAGL